MPAQVYPYMPSTINIERFEKGNNIVDSIPGATDTTGKKISADDIITSNARQFITAEEKQMLASMLDAITGTSKHVMYKEMYDRDNDNIVDVSMKSLTTDTVLWNNIIGKPEIPTSIIEKTSKVAHTHDNMEFLDKLGVDQFGNVTFDGKAYELPGNLMTSNVYDIDNDGVIDRALYADSTNWENILNKPLFYMPSPHQHSIKDIDGKINADSLSGVTIDKLMQKTDKVSVDQVVGIDSIEVNVSQIRGGNAASDFDDETNTDETLIVERFDTRSALRSINPILFNMQKCYETETYRHKIGNGINGWNCLPYEYGTPESVKFNTNARKFMSEYYDYLSNTTAGVNLLESNIHNPGEVALYNDTVRGWNNQLIGIPYNATDVMICDYNGDNSATFANALAAINIRGAAWFSGVRYYDYIYCSPYNSNVILKIDSHNRTVELIESPLMLDTGKNAKYTRGVLSSATGMIYFAPHNIDSIMEIDPTDDAIHYYQSGALFDSDANCCAVIENPINKNLYFIPKKNNSIVEFNPITKNIKVAATVNDGGINKFSTAVLAPNGMIYAIPAYGYDYVMIFDPNINEVKYVAFETASYDAFNNAVVAPNGKIYLIPSGSSNKTIVEYDIGNNTFYNLFKANGNDRWCGGVLNIHGHIICLPYTTNKILDINVYLKNKMPLDVITSYIG